MKFKHPDYSKIAIGTRISSALLTVLMAGPVLALDSPQGSAFDQRLRHTVYKADDVYPIHAVNGIVSTIIFAPDEKVTAHSSGFSTAWEFAARGNKFFLKPRAKQGSTNLVIVTNKRIYYFDLKLGWNRKTATYQLVFDYPEDRLARAQEAARKASVDALLKQSPVPDGDDAAKGPVAERNTHYTMNFGKASASKDIAPVRAFDDGRFTYLLMKKQSDFPAAYRVVEDSETLLNSHVEGNWLVIHGVYKELHLRAGQAVVGIYNESFTGGGEAGESPVTVPGLDRQLLTQ